MNTFHPSSKARKWRTLLLLAALFATFAGLWTPSAANAAPQPLSTQHSALSTRYSLAPADDPLPAPAEVATGRFRYFAQTGHFLRGLFLNYWETHGATDILGLPITEALTEDGLVVQYLERAILEWHPEISSDPRQQVLLTRLGATMTEARGLVFDRLPAGENTPNSFFFPETGHNLANAFLTFWQRYGGLAVFGYPISEEVVEINQADGQPYVVQYFERNRFEWHPERGPSENVLLGLLGVEYARSVSLNPLARILLPASIEGADQDLTNSPELAELVEADLLPVVQALGRTPQFSWVPTLIVRNTIWVEFTTGIDEEGVAGAFIATNSRERPYVILIPESERGEPLEALASVIAHEATHAYDAITGALPRRTNCSVEAELRAYMNGLSSWVLLKGDDALSQIYEPRSFPSAVNRSLLNFNGGKTTLDFEFDVQSGREYISELYGPDCGR
jgi:hypothetical protein